MALMAVGVAMRASASIPWMISDSCSLRRCPQSHAWCVGPQANPAHAMELQCLSCDPEDGMPPKVMAETDVQLELIQQCEAFPCQLQLYRRLFDANVMAPPPAAQPGGCAPATPATPPVEPTKPSPDGPAPVPVPAQPSTGLAKATDVPAAPPRVVDPACMATA